MTKYHAKPCVIGGIRFASQKEGRRYRDLLLLARVGKVRNLELQPRFIIRLEGVKVCTYVADFRYEERVNGVWRQVIEDVKGVRTPVYRLKKKLVEAAYGIRVRES